MKYVKWAAIALLAVVMLPVWLFGVAMVVSYPVTAVRIGHIPNDECISIYQSFGGGWQPISTAPRDGTAIETLQTYGLPAWTGRFRWTDVDMLPNLFTGEVREFHVGVNRWSSIDEPGAGVMECDCLFWRPITDKGDRL